jgi:nucleotide-binding universal stress UspA family protein
MMPVSRRYLVAVDFSKGSEAALRHALALAKEDKAKLVLIHVIPATMVYPRESTNVDFYALLERDARENVARLAKRNNLRPGDYRLVLARGLDTADVIARQARQLRVSTIIMGSHGRTGLQRLLLGSVAERTLRYAHCPVLIVKG